MFGLVDWFVSFLFRRRRDRREAAARDALRARGITAPALVVGATMHQERRSEAGHQIRIKYTVDVHPPNAVPFRASFHHWADRRGYTTMLGELQGEAGKHIWVTYDPADPTQMIFEYEEAERAAKEAEALLDARRLEFNALAEPLDALRTTGTPAEAVVVQFEDLQLPYPRRQSTAVRLHVDVTSPGGDTYRAVIPGLFATSAFAKYGEGRRVFVRVDPLDPQRVVLDSERNANLPR
jgi:hypothetical protein